MEEKQYKAYEYNTMMKTAYLWLPILALVLYVCATFEKIRIFLFLTVGSATLWWWVGKLKNKSAIIKFKKNYIEIGDDRVYISDVNNYYTCLPLNKLFLLRIKTKSGKEVFYIEKEFRKEIENIMNDYKIPLKKTNNDIWLKYSHLTLSFAILIIVGIVMKIQYIIKYNTP